MKIKQLRIFYYKPKISQKNQPLPTFMVEKKIFIILLTSDGIEGYGEPSHYAGKSSLILKTLKELFNSYVKNQNPIFFEEIHTNIKKNYKEQNNVFFGCLSAINQSLFDINSKIHNKPLYKLLNPKIKNNPRIKLYASGGMIFEKYKYDILIDEVIESQERGFYGWKFRPKTPNNNLSHFQRINKPPDFNYKELIDFCYKIRKVSKKNFKLMVDFGKRIHDLKTAKYIFEALNDLNFFLVEEPLKINFIKYKQLKKKYSSFNIAAGESIGNFIELKKWIDKNFLDIYQPDSNLIPLLDLLKILKNIHYQKNKFILHNWSYHVSMASNYYLASSSNLIKMVEYNLLVEKFIKDISNNNFKLLNGNISINDNLGLGVNFDKYILRKNIIYDSK